MLLGTARATRVAEGTRTPDHRDHNPGLYQLSYCHRAAEDGIRGHTMALLRGQVVVLLLAVAAALGAAPPAAPKASTFCTGAQLTGKFAVVPNSAGAGNIVYALTLRNRSTSPCTIAGLPDVTLLGRSGQALPTHIRAALPNTLTSVLVHIAPGRWARATARFSPNVPGEGEPLYGRRCEPMAYKLTVRAPGGGKTLAPVTPPTPVCEHGQLQLSAYAAGR